MALKALYTHSYEVAHTVEDGKPRRFIFNVQSTCKESLGAQSEEIRLKGIAYMAKLAHDIKGTETICVTKMDTVVERRPQRLSNVLGLRHSDLTDEMIDQQPLAAGAVLAPYKLQKHIPDIPLYIEGGNPRLVAVADDPIPPANEDVMVPSRWSKFW